MQQIDPFPDPRPRPIRLPCQKRPRPLIDIARPIRRGDGKGIRRVARIGKGKVAQSIDRDRRKGRHPIRGQADRTAHRIGKDGIGGIIGQKAKGRPRHPQPRQRRKDKCHRRNPRHLAMPAPRHRAAHRRKPARPPALTRRNQRRPRQAKHQHRQRRCRRRPTPRILHQKGTVEIRQPPLHRRRVRRPGIQPGRRIDHRRPGPVTIEPIGRDPPRRRAADLLHRRMRRQNTRGQIAHALPHDGRRGRHRLHRRKDRQGHAADRQRKKQDSSQKPRPAVKAAQHGVLRQKS